MLHLLSAAATLLILLTRLTVDLLGRVLQASSSRLPKPRARRTFSWRRSQVQDDIPITGSLFQSAAPAPEDGALASSAMWASHRSVTPLQFFCVKSPKGGYNSNTSEYMSPRVIDGVRNQVASCCQTLACIDTCLMNAVWQSFPRAAGGGNAAWMPDRSSSSSSSSSTAIVYGSASMDEGAGVAEPEAGDDAPPTTLDTARGGSVSSAHAPPLARRKSLRSCCPAAAGNTRMPSPREGSGAGTAAGNTHSPGASTSAASGRKSSKRKNSPGPSSKSLVRAHDARNLASGATLC